MDILRQYVVSVVTAAIICGILIGLSQKITAKQALKLVCGLFLTVTVIRPIVKIDLTSFLDTLQISFPEGEAAVAAGKNLSQDALQEIIKENTEAYILDKAAELNACLEAEITLSEDAMPVPVAVTLSGDIAPYAKLRLEKVITEELGIAKENLLWTG